MNGLRIFLKRNRTDIQCGPEVRPDRIVCFDDDKVAANIFLSLAADKYRKILDCGGKIHYNVTDYGILCLGIPKSPLLCLGRLFCLNNAFQKVHNTRKYSELFETFVMTKSLAPYIKTELSEMPYERI